MNVVDLVSVFFCIVALSLDLSMRAQIPLGPQSSNSTDGLAPVVILFRALRLTRVIRSAHTAQQICVNGCGCVWCFVRQ